MKHETARQDVPGLRVRCASARLQGRPYPRPLPDRTRQDSPQPIVRNVCATPASACHRDQARAPARPAALHQRVRRLSRWRAGDVGSLTLGVLLFAALAPVSLVALPFGALLLAAGPGTRGEWLWVALAAGAGTTLVAVPPGGMLDALSRLWIVLVTVAFVAGAALRPPGQRRFWRLALRACLYAAAGVMLLVGPDARRRRPRTHEQHRSEEHTSELQSLRHLVCRLLLEKKKWIHQEKHPSEENNYH